MMTSTQVLSLQNLPAACPTCSTHFSQPFAHYPIITPLSSKPINPLALLPLFGSSLTSAVLSPPAAVWNAPTSPHTLFNLKLLRSATNRYHKFIAATRKSLYASLFCPHHLNLELFGKLSIISYTELQIAPYPHHPLWQPYHSYLSHTSLIKSQSFISTYKPTPLPSQLFLSHLYPSSTALFLSCHLTRN